MRRNIFITVISVLLLVCLFAYARTVTPNLGLTLPTWEENADILVDYNADFNVVDAIFDDVSLDELSYLNGVTSNIQTQLNLKSPLTSPTFTGTVTIPTPFTLGAVSVLPTGTELNFVDGVTSAIQTQLNAKAATLSGTISEIAYFNSTSTISSLAVATYPSLTEFSYVKGVTSAIQTQLGLRYLKTEIDTEAEIEAIIGVGLAHSGANSDVTAMTGLTTALAANYGGTGVLNNAAETITIGGAGTYPLTLTLTAATNVTLPTSGTLLAAEVDPNVDSDAELKAILADEVTKTGTFTAGKVVKVNNATGIIEEGTNTDSDIADAVTKKHTQNTDTALGIQTQDLVFEGATANEFETTFVITDPTADRVITFPNSDQTLDLSLYYLKTAIDTKVEMDAIWGVTIATTANKLSAFAATTSAELAGVISDETGTDKLVYNTSPVLVTPTLGAASATSINLTGGQIAFPATAVPSADVNTLDDYEEGTWTMGVSFGGGTTGITYSSNTGYYTKIGNIVTISGRVSLTSKGTSTGEALITGLPFTVVSNPAGYGAVMLRLLTITFANQFQGYVGIDTTTIFLEEITEAGVITAITDADFINTSGIIVNCTYRIK